MNRLIIITSIILLSLVSVKSMAQVQVRKSVLKNPDIIKEYREVVAAMKALPVSDPRSWKYQSGVHMHFDATSLPPGNPYVNHSLTLPPHALANSTWDQCHQSDPDRLFLLWHRVYVFYFEQIAKKVSSKPDFTMPYWDYGAESQSRTIPVEFRSPTYIDPITNADMTNPLYELRRASINNGAALDLATVLPNGLDESDFHDFGLALERNPHNAVHSALGDENGLAMGIPNFAAQDPIFWLHHSNIDRIYSCWETRFSVPTLTDDGNTYQFINGDGQVVSHTVSQMQQLVNDMTYEYEDLTDCKQLLPAPTAPEAAETPFGQLEKSAVEGSAIVLGKYASETVLKGTPVSVELKMDAAAKTELRKAFTFETVQPVKAAAIEVKGFSLKNSPGVSFRVYLKPAGSDDATMIPVGSMSFFQHLSVGGENLHHPQEKDYYFEIKYLPVEIQQSGVEVVFVPTTGVEGDNAISPEAIKRAEPKFKEVNLIMK